MLVKPSHFRDQRDAAAIKRSKYGTVYRRQVCCPLTFWRWFDMRPAANGHRTKNAQVNGLGVDALRCTIWHNNELHGLSVAS